MNITLEGVFDAITIAGLKPCKLPANANQFLGSFNCERVYVWTNHRFIFIRLVDRENDNAVKTYKTDWTYTLEQNILDIV